MAQKIFPIDNLEDLLVYDHVLTRYLKEMETILKRYADNKSRGNLSGYSELIIFPIELHSESTLFGA